MEIGFSHTLGRPDQCQQATRRRGLAVLPLTDPPAALWDSRARNEQIKCDVYMSLTWRRVLYDNIRRPTSSLTNQARTSSIRPTMYAHKSLVLIALMGHTLALSYFSTVVIPATTGLSAAKAADVVSMESASNSTLIRSRDVRAACEHPRRHSDGEVSQSPSTANMQLYTHHESDIPKWCWCYDDDKVGPRPETARIEMGRASDKACNQWCRLKWGDGEGFRKVHEDQYTYSIDGVKGAGLIRYRLELVNGRDREKCRGPLDMNWHLCSDVMRDIIDSWSVLWSFLSTRSPC